MAPETRSKLSRLVGSLSIGGNKCTICITDSVGFLYKMAIASN